MASTKNQMNMRVHKRRHDAGHRFPMSSLQSTHHTILPTHPTRPSSRGFEQDIGVKFATLRHDATYDRRMRIQIAMLMLFLASCAEEPDRSRKDPGTPQPAPGITARGVEF